MSRESRCRADVLRLCTVDGGEILMFDEIEEIGDLLGIEIQIDFVHLKVEDHLRTFVMMFFRLQGDQRFATKIRWTKN